MSRSKLSRRRFMATSAAAAAAVSAPFVRTAHAAGKVSIGFWDHWVPGANDVTKKIVQE
ncbi:twin-arginine translocation signal domain-containing protein, partial [Acinetobacter baumannii]